MATSATTTAPVTELQSGSLPLEGAHDPQQGCSSSLQSGNDAVQVVFGAIQQSIEGTSFSLPSEQARAALSLGRELFSNFYPKRNEQTRAACKNIVNMLYPKGIFARDGGRRFGRCITLLGYLHHLC